MSDITGKIIQVLPEQRFNGKNGEIVKNAFVIEWLDNNYKQQLLLEVIGADKWDKMRQCIYVGNEVFVKYSVSSREWNGRWFTSCTCFYCAATNGGNTQQRQPEPPIQNMPPSNDTMPF